jgi:hypothetical protein
MKSSCVRERMHEEAKDRLLDLSFGQDIEKDGVFVSFNPGFDFHFHSFLHFPHTSSCPSRF